MIALPNPISSKEAEGVCVYVCVCVCVCVCVYATRVSSIGAKWHIQESLIQLRILTMSN